MSVKKKVNRIFIANRGEIARRIGQTARRLGIESVCLNDRKIPPAYLVGVITDFVTVDHESTDLYLNAQKMIEFAKISHCDAVHPGFGFLSENSQFADQVIAAGLTWIGPRPGAIEAMASKATARIQAEKSGVPCLPGINGLDFAKDETKALEELDEFAAQHGFPILIKAAYGGGGKGMRIATKSDELIDQAKRAASEALSSFGNASLIVEKYLPAPRHVEVQVLGDKHGNIAIIGDRDCSLQRRHQKILEEAPAPNIPTALRESMHKAARGLALAVGYDSAGTVEFLLDESQADSPSFYFLEMNTRLQVEHTVTEEVFSIDLVEWQIRSACNELLGPDVLNARPRGHSIEVRIYAEDPGMNFFPAPGPVRTFVPATGRGIRWEIGLDAIDEISTRFDPMISKLICTAGNRAEAMELLAQTLERTLFSGPRNNIPFLIWLARNSQVLERPVSTHFISSNVDAALKDESSQRQALGGLATELLDKLEKRNFGNQSALSISNPDHHTITASAFSRTIPALVKRHSDVSVEIHSSHVVFSSVEHSSSSRYGFGSARTSSHRAHFFSFVVFQAPTLTEYWIGMNGHNWVRVDQGSSTIASEEDSATSDGLAAPVPGKVLSIATREGEEVVKGQLLFVLESMKMQFEVKAGRSGVIDSLKVSVGDQLQAAQILGTWR
jgi:acetyl/propionyl-CoA carboxylase alpha subunit